MGIVFSSEDHDETIEYKPIVEGDEDAIAGQGNVDAMEGSAEFGIDEELVVLHHSISTTTAPATIRALKKYFGADTNVRS